MSDTDTADYRLIVSFPDQSASFVHGYEAGQIGYRMQFTAEQSIEETVHSANAEVLTMMGIAYGWEMNFEDTEPPVEGWSIVKMSRLPVRHGLVVVK